MIEIIPAIDLINGKCVRLSKGDYTQKTEYRENPVEMAQRFEDHGMKRLHLVDLDGARAGKVMNYRVLERIAGHTRLVIDAGGGLYSDEDLRIVFESGASMATGGSLAVKNPALFKKWLETYGSHRIILGSDFLDGNIVISGWQEQTGYSLYEFLQDWMAEGIKQTICTDVSKDGLLQGSAVTIYRAIRERFPDLYMVASGGIATLEDIHELEGWGIPAVIIGKAIYEGKIRLNELAKFL